MFDIGALELLLIVVVAIIVIGPKDMPAALRVAGRWVGKLRRASAQFRSGFDTIVREAEMEEMEKKWKEQNAKIMAETPDGEMGPLTGTAADVEESGGAKASSATAESKPADLLADVEPSAESAVRPKQKQGRKPAADEPMLPLDKSQKS